MRRGRPGDTGTQRLASGFILLGQRNSFSASPLFCVGIYRISSKTSVKRFTTPNSVRPA